MTDANWYDLSVRLLLSLNLRYGIEPLTRTAERVEAQYGNAVANAWLGLARRVEARGES